MSRLFCFLLILLISGVARGAFVSELEIARVKSDVMRVPGIHPSLAACNEASEGNCFDVKGLPVRLYKVVEVEGVKKLVRDPDFSVVELSRSRNAIRAKQRAEREAKEKLMREQLAECLSSILMSAECRKVIMGAIK